MHACSLIYIGVDLVNDIRIVIYACMHVYIAVANGILLLAVGLHA